MLIQQKQAIFPLCDVNLDFTASAELNSFSMKNYNHAAVFIQVASTLAFGIGASAPILSLECATSDSGDTVDATFHYSVNTASAAVLSTVMSWSADATSSALSNATVGDWAGHTILLQIDGDELPSTSTGKVYDWITVDFTNATTGTISAWAVLSEPRYAGASMPIAV